MENARQVNHRRALRREKVLTCTTQRSRKVSRIVIEEKMAIFYSDAIERRAVEFVEDRIMSRKYVHASN